MIATVGEVPDAMILHEVRLHPPHSLMALTNPTSLQQKKATTPPKPSLHPLLTVAAVKPSELLSPPVLPWAVLPLSPQSTQISQP
jgi:hypothetical protein